MLSIPYLNTCERPLSPGNYIIPYHNTWGSSPLPPSGRVAHLYTTIASSTGTLVYNLFTSRDTTSSSSSNLVASRAALASFKLVSIFAPGNFSKKGEKFIEVLVTATGY